MKKPRVDHDDKFYSGKIVFGVTHAPNFVLMGAGYAGSTGAGSKWYESNENKHFMDFRLRNNYPAATVRGLYLRVRSYGAASTGEALRAYYEAYGTQAQCHGAHITASVQKDGAAITGQICGLRATLDTGSDLTLTGGGYYALRLDTNLNSAVSGVTKSGIMYVAELQSNRVANFLVTEGTVGFLKGSGCGTTPQDALVVSIAGTTRYIPLMNAT